MEKSGKFGARSEIIKNKGTIKVWNKEVFGLIDHRIKALENEAAVVERKIDEQGMQEVDVARLTALRGQLKIWYGRKENYWKQMSRDHILKNIDRNTKYFQTVASIKRRRKLMVEIKKSRRMIREPRAIKREVRRFYKDLYKQKVAPIIEFEEGLVNKISPEEAATLEALPTEEEIKSAAWPCDPSKAPGADGFNLTFIRSCWETLGRDFTSCVLHFFLTGTLTRKLNMTWVTLVVKFEGAQEIKDYRPIRMVGCVYKVIAKILTNRLSSVMAQLVGESQFAFVQGRQILDGALIACEVVQWLKKKRKAATLLKLDFQKAYDSVRWSFIDHVLDRMGFGSRWRSWISYSLSTTDMSIIIFH